MTDKVRKSGTCMVIALLFRRIYRYGKKYIGITKYLCKEIHILRNYDLLYKRDPGSQINYVKLSLQESIPLYSPYVVGIIICTRLLFPAVKDLIPYNDYFADFFLCLMIMGSIVNV